MSGHYSKERKRLEISLPIDMIERIKSDMERRETESLDDMIEYYIDGYWDEYG